MTGPAQPAGRVQNSTFTAQAEASHQHPITWAPGVLTRRLDAAKKNGPDDESSGPRKAEPPNAVAVY
jgi:hypothetical protein